MSDLESLVSDSEVGIIISLSWTLDFFLILIRKLALFSFSPLRACISQRRNQWFRQRGHGTRTLTKFFPTSGYSWTFIEIVVFDPNLVGRLPKNLTNSKSHWGAYRCMVLKQPKTGRLIWWASIRLSIYIFLTARQVGPPQVCVTAMARHASLRFLTACYVEVDPGWCRWRLGERVKLFAWESDLSSLLLPQTI